MEAEDQASQSIQMRAIAKTRSFDLRAIVTRSPGAGASARSRHPPEREQTMAYLLRSLAIIGVIALNSPVHGGKPADATLAGTARAALRSATGIDAKAAASNLMAAREAAQILAGLDAQTRERLLAATTASLAPRSEASVPARPR
jgi:hypothetical protein